MRKGDRRFIPAGLPLQFLEHEGLQELPIKRTIALQGIYRGPQQGWHIGADFNFAFPSAEIAVMGAKGASEIIFKREISSAEDPEAMLAEKEKEYAELFANPYSAAERGFIDEVIEPRETRRKLIKAYAILENKMDSLPPKKHGNIPL